MQSFRWEAHDWVYSTLYSVHAHRTLIIIICRFVCVLCMWVFYAICCCHIQRIRVNEAKKIELKRKQTGGMIACVSETETDKMKTPDLSTYVYIKIGSSCSFTRVICCAFILIERLADVLWRVWLEIEIFIIFLFLSAFYFCFIVVILWHGV